MPVHPSHSNGGVLADGRHIHASRHTGPCLGAQAGVPAPVVQGRLGHANLSTTQRYVTRFGAW
ncbi:MAG: tyrosine-type recombinase/integrase [Propionibacteriaceae bacterium]|nr:tyrosine-type recombinase/integrase [Propionibacteriaceae bacterium]